MTGVVPYKQLNVPDPIAVAIDAMDKGWLSGRSSSAPSRA